MHASKTGMPPDKINGQAVRTGGGSLWYEKPERMAFLSLEAVHIHADTEPKSGSLRPKNQKNTSCMEIIGCTTFSIQHSPAPLLSISPPTSGYVRLLAANARACICALFRDSSLLVRASGFLYGREGEIRCRERDGMDMQSRSAVVVGRRKGRGRWERVE